MMTLRQLDNETFWLTAVHSDEENILGNILSYKNVQKLSALKIILTKNLVAPCKLLTLPMSPLVDLQIQIKFLKVLLNIFPSEV